MRRLVLLVLFASPALAAPPKLHGPPATAKAILGAELAFEQQSERQGAAIAFGRVMDPVDGLEFDGTGAPLRGTEAVVRPLRKQDEQGTLAWAPREVFASTGDMGTVWGDWQFHPRTGKTTTGRYVTVWRRDTTGTWKVIVDIGTPDP